MTPNDADKEGRDMAMEPPDKTPEFDDKPFLEATSEAKSLSKQ